MSKILNFKTEAREKLLVGINTLADAVKVTMGAMGRNVVIERPFLAPHITKDGVSVAKEVFLPCPTENMGCDIIREAASKTADIVGDATTTSTVLAQEMIRLADIIIKNGVNPQKIKRGMQQAQQDVISVLNNLSNKLDINSVELNDIAYIAANNDRHLSNLIVDAIRRVGSDGIVLVDDSKTNETYSDFLKGVTIDRGYISEYFVTNPEKMIAQYENPLILFVDKNIKAIQELTPVIEACNSNGIKTPLVIIADDIIEQALNVLVTNKIQRGLEVIAIKSPSFGDNRKDLMKDMAVATGGTYISDTNGISLEKLCTLSQKEILMHLGDCEKITVSKNSTTIIGGKGDKDEILVRANSIKSDITNTSTPHYLSQMKDRVAKLTGGVAVIYSGAATEIEMKEKKDRIDDAICATKSALEEGYVAGGGRALAYIKDVLSHNKEEIDGNSKDGYDVVINALTAPARQILENAGYDYIHIKGDRNGIDATDGEIKDLINAGIIDSTKAIRVALENAVSVASMWCTTDVTISMIKEDKPKEMFGM